MDYLTKLIGAIEEHDVAAIKDCFENGISPNDYYNNDPLLYELTSEYARSSRFKNCVRTFIEYGLAFEDKVLLAVLADDASLLSDRLTAAPEEVVRKNFTLRCAYTPFYEVTLLHICAEFNHLSCAEVLVAYGADVNGKAGIDEHGFGGQTPIFHTVNQNGNQSMDMLQYLLSKTVDLKLTVAGLIWGKGYPWETLVPSVNPVSYAMMGLLPQMHRNEITIATVVSLLLKAGYGIDYASPNVPNAYLKKG